MAPSKVRSGIVSLSLLITWALAVVAAPPAAAADPTPCRVRNVTQDTAGRSLIKMAEAAVDGDQLRVRGTCPGTVVVQADIRIVGVGDGGTLTGRDRVRVLVVGGDTVVRLRGLRIEHGVAPTDKPWACGGMTVRQGATVALVNSVVRRNNASWAICTQRSTSLDVIRSVVAANGGGGILVDGTATLTDSAVRGNTGVQGGGIVNGGTLTLTSSSVTGNRSRDEGGGIFNVNGTVTLIDSVVSDNRAPSLGGGIYNLEGTVTIIDSVVSDNRARNGGGGIKNDVHRGATAILALIGSIVRDNSTRGSGGGIGNLDGGVSLKDSHVTHNSAGTEGGGIYSSNGSVTLDGASSVTDNTPDDCVGTQAC